MADPTKVIKGGLNAIRNASKAADEAVAAGKLKAALEAQQAPMTRPQGTGLPLMPRDDGMYTLREQKDLPRMPTVDKARAANKSPKYNERTQDLLDSRKARGKVDDLINKGKDLNVQEWYGTEPLRQVALNAGRTPEQFESLMAQLASASQRNPVDKQNQMGSYLYHLSETGQLPENSLLLTNKLKKALKDDPLLAEGRTLVELPTGYGSLAQGDIFNRALMISQGKIGEALPPNKKLGTFYENLLGNLQPVTVDVNALRGPIIEQGDPRWLASKLVEKDDKGKVINSYKPREMFDTGEMTMREAKQRPGFWEAAPKGAEYAGFEELWQRGAKRHNVEPAEAQALGWYGSADVTALKTKPENYVDNLERLIKRTAEQTGKSPAEVMDDLVKGKGFLRKEGGAVDRQESQEDTALFHKLFAMHKASGGVVAINDRVHDILKAPSIQMVDGGKVIKGLMGAFNKAEKAADAAMAARKAPQEDALRLAQQRAALPKEQNGLGLPVNNTAMDRAKALGYPMGKGFDVSYEKNHSPIKITNTQPKPTSPRKKAEVIKAELEQMGIPVTGETAATGSTYLNIPGKPYDVSPEYGGGQNVPIETLRFSTHSKKNNGQFTNEPDDSFIADVFPKGGNTLDDARKAIDDLIKEGGMRSRNAAFDPFRRNAAIAAAMGVLAPDLMAEEQEKATGGRVQESKEDTALFHKLFAMHKAPSIQMGGGGKMVKGLMGAFSKAEKAANEKMTAIEKARKAADMIPTARINLPAPGILIPSKMNNVREAVRNIKGNYGARRVERAADEIPNLERMFQEDALKEAFTGDNARGMMTINPADFEKYAQELSKRISVDPKAAKLAKQGDIDKMTVSTDEYIKYLQRLQNGFDDVPYLNLFKDEVGLPTKASIIGHEGRHRNRALADQGKTASLVQVNPRGDLREGMPRRTQEDFIEALKEELDSANRLVLPETYFDNIAQKEIKRPPIELPDIYAKGGRVQESPEDIALFHKLFAMHKANGGAIKKPQKFDGGGIAVPEESPTPSENDITKAGHMTELLAKMAKEQGKQEVSSLSKPRAVTDLINRGVLANNPLSAIVDMVNMGLIPLDILGTALTGREIKVSSDKPFLGSEYVKDLMKKYNVTSDEERPMMETALSFASPTGMIKGAQGVTKGAVKAASAMRKPMSGLGAMREKTN